MSSFKNRNFLSVFIVRSDNEVSTYQKYLLLYRNKRLNYEFEGRIRIWFLPAGVTRILFSMAVKSGSGSGSGFLIDPGYLNPDLQPCLFNIKCFLYKLNNGYI